MLEVLKYPDERLQQISKPIDKFDSKLHKLIDQMEETMYAENGIGLAAPQVGSLIRLFVIDIGGSEPENQKLYEFINPKLINPEGKIVFEEGCLSVPGVTEKVSRKEKITIQYQDRHGKHKELRAEGLLSVAIQHENDHLEGILFIEKLSPLKRRMVKKKLKKSVVL